MAGTIKKRTRGRKPEYQINIAAERIGILFGLAEKEFRSHPERSRRYVQLARKIGMRYNVRLTKDQKRGFCKYCNTLLKPGLTCSQRTNNGVIVIKCLECNKLYRYPLRNHDKKTMVQEVER